jgi:manganese oxidase
MKNQAQLSFALNPAAACLVLALILAISCFLPALAQPGNYAGMGEQQAATEDEVRSMKSELGDIKSTTQEAIQGLNQLNTQMLKQAVQEVHLFCKESAVELMPGTTVHCLTYNGHLPGPTIHVREGQMLRIVLHNQTKHATSLHFHGLILPESIDGLASRDETNGLLVKPGATYAYQFAATPAGTYWYSPQIIHSDQKANGLYGALIVDAKPEGENKVYDQEQVMILSSLEATPSKELSAHAQSLTGTTPAPQTAKVFTALSPNNYKKLQTEMTTFYLMNGQCAPAIPPLAVQPGSRIKLRFINASQAPIPIHLSGHRFELDCLNGDPLGAHFQTTRDTLTLGVSDRADIEFTADNPGVWSLGSEAVEQATNNGKFPGGIACVVIYAAKAQ